MSALSSWNKDPEVWISKLEVIRKRLKKMSNEISNEDTMIHILNNLPQEFNMVVDAMERKLDDLVDPLTLRSTRESKTTKESVKIQKMMKKARIQHCLVYIKFQGRCYNCG